MQLVDGAPAGVGLLHGAVLGHPIGHSKSPALHRAAYAHLGVPFDYVAIDVQQHQLAGLLGRVRVEGDWYGLSVTMPLKNVALPLLDEVTAGARLLGAVNTVVVRPGGTGGPTLAGHNTDVAGIANALRHAGLAVAGAGGLRAAVLGGGGTAVSALAALAGLGAGAVDVYVRSPERAAGTAEVARTLGLDCALLPYAGAAAALSGYDVVVSTLPPRGADELAAGLAGAHTAGKFLLDVAYDPWPSALAGAWAAGGGTIVPGIEMLLYQAVEQARLFTAVPGAGLEAAFDESGVINVMCDAIGLARR